MPYLVLDLDETALVVTQHRDQIAPSHCLSTHQAIGEFFWKDNVVHCKFNVINPQQLSELIEHACQKYDGVLILTAGLWLPSVRTRLATLLDLTNRTTYLLENCIFHSPLVDEKLLNASVEELRYMNKKTRLEKIRANNPKLQDKHFVILDNEPFHIESFMGVEWATPVLATTNKDAMDYYSMALKALEHGAGSEKFPRNLVEPNSKKRLFLDHAYFFKKEKTAEALPPKTEMTTCKMNE